jgi:VIT1/CCC1 family predicted Fe2+/Mn2+ transporter
MIDIYKKHGLKEKVSSEVVELLSNNKESFIDIMIVEKLGMRAEVGQPIVNSLITFFSFSLLGFIPLIPLIISSWLNFAKK